MKLHVSFVFYTVTLALLLWSCHEEEAVESQQGKNPVDVYVTGAEGGYAVYWKNGDKITLDAPGSAGLDIAVSGSDVYVAGYDVGSRALYWKNGNKVVLAPKGSVFDIEIAGSDVYVTGGITKQVGGKDLYMPAYWKNGVINELKIPAGYERGETRAICVDGPDVYVTGSVSSASGAGTRPPIVWKNGEPQELPVPAPGEYIYTSSTASGIKVVDGHVYISGIAVDRQHPESIPSPTRALVWKDGELNVLASSEFSSEAQRLDVVSGNVYAVGRETGLGTGSTGKYWKNGVEVIIGTGYNLNGIAVVDGDIYLAGENWNVPITISSVAAYWVNGERVDVGSGAVFSYAYGLCVVPRP